MALHRQSLELMEKARALGVANVVGMEWPAVRELEMRELELKGDAPAVASRELSIPSAEGGVDARLYLPAATAGAIVVYFHGGGWCAGSVALSDPECRVLAERAGAVVVSVDYRLAPEHPYPAGPEDCWAAVRWVAEHRRELAPAARRLATMGSSAGGNLAAALRARDEGGPAIDLQVLLCPTVDLGFDSPSCAEDLGGSWLSAADIKDLAAAYMGGREPDATAAPALAQDLGGLPRALIVTAEFDVLRDEAETYGRRLAEAGVPVRAVRFPGMLHGFYEYRAVVDAAEDVWTLAAEAIRG
ncbi:MAG: alpha/beta hydrolase [Actinobacteria bacterium]|nr:alpha/beta hydrolase [Actinomycetota bacterium]